MMMIIIMMMMMMMMMMIIIIIKDLLFQHSHKPHKNTFVLFREGDRDGTVVRVLASRQCGSGSIVLDSASCGLSLLLVQSSCSERFFSG